MTDFTNLTDLALERLGGRALVANDEFFAPKENLLKPGRGEFLPDRFTDHGKWMDGWETRRRREPGHDWCIVKLAVPGEIHGVNIDTNHFRGNHPEAASVDACRVETDPSAETLAGSDELWTTILPKQTLQGHSENPFPVEDAGCYTHVRLNIYPDGGVARLRVHGVARPCWKTLAASGTPVDLASALHGGVALDCSDQFFCVPGNLLLPDRPANMGDGWETKRRRGPGHDWCVIQLGCRGTIETIEVDTTHFKGNHPAHCSLEAIEPDADGDATEILSATELGPNTVHRFEVAPDRRVSCTHVRFNIYPDGGVSRLRLLGRPEPAG